MKIDFHTHLFSNDIKENRQSYFYDKNFSLLYNNKKSRITSVEELLKSMSDHNIDYSVIMGHAWEGIDLCKRENDYFINISEKYSQLLPFAALPALPFDKIDLYIKDLADAGFKGLGELSFYKQELSEKVIDYINIIFKNAAKYNLLVSLHLNEPIGHHYTGKYPPQFKKIYDLILNNPETKIVLAHWGGGIFFYELMPEVKKIFKNIYYDTAASPFIYDNNIYLAAKTILDQKKIIYGSDYPLIKPQRYFGEILSVINDNTFIGNIIGNNAKMLLNL